MLFSRKPKTDTIPAEIAGVPVLASGRARRMALRVDSRSGAVVLVWPRRACEKKAIAFVEENRGWIEAQRLKAKPRRAFLNGGTLCLYGRSYRIFHAGGRGVTRLEEDRIVVHGGIDHLSRRVCDFLKEEAKKTLKALSNKKAGVVGLSPVPICVRDPKTRWGSCGPDGRLMYSWRLVLAPPQVLDYVVAHEVAHRVHMNHGRKFWALCLSLCEDGVSSRRWLKTYGHELMGYG